MSPTPRKKKDKEELESPESTLESPESTSDSGVATSNTPESDIASEDIEEVPPAEVAELDAEAVSAEADETAGAQEEAPEGDETPAEKPKPRRRRAPAKAKADEKADKAEKDETPKAPARSRTPATAPRRRRSQREPGAPIPVVRAQAKFVRGSARKARLVCDHIRGKSVDEARAILAHTPRAAARDWSKLLESAVANAEHNHELVGEDLYVKAVHADEGPTIRRYRPRAMGRATKIRKRTAHLTILLTPKD
jgi:ribosomal protein L22